MTEWLEKFLSASVVVSDITSVIAKCFGHVQCVRKVIRNSLDIIHICISWKASENSEGGGEVSNTTIFNKESLKLDSNFRSDMKGGRGGSNQNRYSIFLGR